MLSQAVDAMSEGPATFGKLRGPAKLGESIKVITQWTGGGFLAAHDRWVVESRLELSHRSRYEHRVLSKALEMGYAIDADDEASGAHLSPSLRQHVAAEMAKEAVIQKDRRKAQEAREHGRSKPKNKGGAKGSDGAWVGPWGPLRVCGLAARTLVHAPARRVAGQGSTAAFAIAW